MTKYKVLVMVMCSNLPAFRKLERAIKQTWASITYPDVKVIFYTDNRRKLIRKKHPVFKDPDLVLPCKDGYMYCLEKTLQAFEFVSASFNFDYIFRTNLGSFIDFSNMVSFLENKPKTGFYCGIMGVYQKDIMISYASGSGFFLSKDLVELILKERNELDHQLIDDVALGMFMTQHGVIISPEARRLSYIDDTNEYQTGNETVTTIPEDQLYHIRLRSVNRAVDIKRMHLLFNQKKAIDHR